MNGTSFTEQSNNNGLETGIEHPHDHDVLSGRGNFVNYHAGNEHFRALVRKHKLNYVACPKPQKGKFSRVIVDEIRSRGGRFLKQDHSTKMWCEIGDKKALDKTRQALREGAPDILREIDPEDEDEGEVSQGMHSIHQGFGGASGFGVNNNNNNQDGITNFASINQSGILQQTPNMVPSSMATASSQVAQHVLQQQLANRVVPGMLQIPAGTTQLGVLRGSGGGGDGLGNLAGDIQQDPYGVDQFEPTPINPHGQIRVAQLADPQARDRPAPAPASRGIQRDNSLTFENLFAKDNAANSGPTKITNKRTMEGSSQHLSAMSFSIGDMTDASNLSAVFEDSMRISDDAAAESRYEKAKQAAAAAAMTSTSTMDKRKPQATHSNANIDMSVASLGSLGLESSMMHMSCKSGFDEDSTKDGR